MSIDDLSGQVAGGVVEILGGHEAIGEAGQPSQRIIGISIRLPEACSHAGNVQSKNGACSLVGDVEGRAEGAGDR